MWTMSVFLDEDDGRLFVPQIRVRLMLEGCLYHRFVCVNVNVVNENCTAHKSRYHKLKLNFTFANLPVHCTTSSPLLLGEFKLKSNATQKSEGNGQ